MKKWHAGENKLRRETLSIPVAVAGNSQSVKVLKHENFVSELQIATMLEHLSEKLTTTIFLFIENLQTFLKIFLLQFQGFLLSKVYYKTR